MSRHCKDCRWKNELVDQPHCRNCVAFSNWSPELDSMPSAIRKYIENNIESPYAVQHAIYNSVINPKKHSNSIPAIKDVIFNPPATIIIWEDKTKTVVKRGEYDVYDPEKGMAMAIARKALGDKGSYYNTFEKWLEKCDWNPCGHCIYSGQSINDEPCFACANSYGKRGTDADNVSVEIKNCKTCKYMDMRGQDRPCAHCSNLSKIYANNYWEPKESDD